MVELLFDDLFLPLVLSPCEVLVGVQAERLLSHSPSSPFLSFSFLRSFLYPSLFLLLFFSPSLSLSRSLRCTSICIDHLLNRDITTTCQVANLLLLPPIR